MKNIENNREIPQDPIEKMIKGVLIGKPEEDKIRKETARKILNRENVIGIFDAGWNNIAAIEVKKGQCSVCNEEKIVVTWDGSCGEFDSALICKECVSKATEKFKEPIYKE